ncbi:pre-mRNA-splicing factor Slt11p [Diutina rugosa]
MLPIKSLQMDDNSICAACYGSKIKVTRQSSGAECRFCTRPFASIRWHASDKTSTSKTVVCTTCAKHRRCCQVCMLDIDFNISLDIRDTALEMAGLHPLIPRGGSDANSNREREHGIADKLEERSKQECQANQILHKLALKLGKTKTKNSSLKKRKIGLPVSGPFDTLKDNAISSFFLFGFPPTISRQLIIDNIPSVSEVIIKPRARCGFIKFPDHEAALEWAGTIMKSKLNIDRHDRPALLIFKGVPMRVSWSPVVDLGEDDENLARQIHSAMIEAAKSPKPQSIKHARISKPATKAISKREVKYSLDSEL